MPRRPCLVLTAGILGLLCAACTTSADVTTAPTSSPEPVLLVDKLPDPCEVDESLLAELVDSDLTASKEGTGAAPACEWVTSDGEGVVVSRTWVSDWLQQAPGTFEGLRSSGFYDDVALGTFDDVERILAADGELDPDAACDVYRLTLKSYPDPGLDHVTVNIDTAAGTRAVFTEHDSGRQSLHVMTCEAGVLTSLQVVDSDMSGSEEEFERALDVATHLFTRS